MKKLAITLIIFLTLLCTGLSILTVKNTQKIKDFKSGVQYQEVVNRNEFLEKATHYYFKYIENTQVFYSQSNFLTWLAKEDPVFYVEMYNYLNSK